MTLIGEVAHLELGRAFSRGLQQTSGFLKMVRHLPSRLTRGCQWTALHARWGGRFTDESESFDQRRGIGADRLDIGRNRTGARMLPRAVGQERTADAGWSHHGLFEPMEINLWALPRGIKRSGLAGKNSLHWISKYGSVAAVVYGFASADGMNEKGLDANVLWLAEADFGSRDDKLPGLSLSLWAQYYLDNFATVAEAIAGHWARPVPARASHRRAQEKDVLNGASVAGR